MKKDVRVAKNVKDIILREARRRGISVDDCVMLYANSIGCGTPARAKVSKNAGCGTPARAKITIELEFV